MVFQRVDVVLSLPQLGMFLSLTERVLSKRSSENLAAWPKLFVNRSTD